MRIVNYLRPVLALIILVSSVSNVFAQYLKLPFEEIAQTADLIFIGTADTPRSRLNEQKSMVFTDVLFKDVRIINASSRSVQRRASVIKFTYAGGSVGGSTVTVSGAPAFTTGHRYLIFMADDGQTYANPLVGGYQGFFEVVKDTRTSTEYLLNASKKAVTGLDAAGLRLSTQRVSAIESGSLILAREDEALTGRVNNQPGTPADGASSSQPFTRKPASAERPLTLSAFIQQLTGVTLKLPLEKRLIQKNGAGLFYHKDGGKVQAEPIQTSTPPVRLVSVLSEDGMASAQAVMPLIPLGASVPGSQSGTRQFGALAPTGGTLGACGYHNLDLVMEQVPTNWWEYAINNDSMYVWNQAMDIYRFVPDDGSWANNSTNEFAGYPSNADVNNQYGFGWGPGALAMTITTMGGGQPTCGRIIQSDICWNPAYSWTDDFSISLNGAPLLLRPINMHELGHSWGEQLGIYVETYDYDVATVMQPYYNNIIEDGWGVHSNDAYLIRRIYDDQRGINGAIRDVGVESYYGLNGLNNSTTNASVYTPGQSITINNVLVENMGYNAVSDMRIRFFLSTNNIISTGDSQLGSYWFWASFPGEAYNVSSYTTAIPTNLPPGTYYVGAIITINGFGNDDLTWNNSTYLYNTITVTCSGTFSASPGIRSFGAGGGDSSVDINTVGSACSWSANSTTSWLTITSGGSGTGSGTINYSVAANTNASSRTAFITFPGGSHRVDQAGGCLVTGTSPIAFGATVSGSLSVGDCLSQMRLRPGNQRPYADRYSFSATAGQQLALTLSSTAFDTYLYLLGPSGTVIAEDDDGGGGHNSRIPAGSGFFSVPSSGNYTIEVTSYAVNETGSYQLSLASGSGSGGGLQFYPLAHPVRLLDTRVGATGCDTPGAMISSGNSRTQTAAGRTCDGLTIPANARALTGNITTVESGGGFLTLYPSDVTRPLVANSNFAANQILNNVFTVGLGAVDGAFKIYVTTNTNVVVDITGYYAPPSASGLYFHPLPHPVRLMDSRVGATACFTPGTQLTAGSTTTQLGTTTCDGVLIPAGTQALVGNATAVGPQANGFLTLFPADATRPLAASSNFQTGIAMNAPFTVGLSPSGQFNIYTAAATNLVVDVLGYFSTQLNDTNGQGLLFNSLATPVRLLDTRTGQAGCFTPGAQMAGGTAYLQSATGACTGVSTAARAVVGNATTVNVSANGFLTFWPSNANQPNVAASNYRSGVVFNRHFTVGLGTDGAFKRFASTTTDLVIDLSGYFAP